MLNNLSKTVFPPVIPIQISSLTCSTCRGVGMGKQVGSMDEESQGDGDSSVVRAPDSRLKGPGFKSL